MKPNISEFSYGYAVTDELVHDQPGITAAPVFPSLYAEGQVGGGYDVMLTYGAIPLFIQFKLSDCMVRGTAAECRLGLLPCPFYRMHLRPSRHSRQHQLLLDLEHSGQLVYYAAPAFHEPRELDVAFLARNVVNRSVWIPPSAIGSLPDDLDHCVSFVPNGNAYFCSDPQPTKRPINASDMLNSLTVEIRQRATSQKLIAIEQALEDVIRVTGEQIGDFDASAGWPGKLRERHPVERLAFYARRFLDAQVYLAYATPS